MLETFTQLSAVVRVPEIGKSERARAEEKAREGVGGRRERKASRGLLLSPLSSPRLCLSRSPLSLSCSMSLPRKVTRQSKCFLWAGDEVTPGPAAQYKSQSPLPPSPPASTKASFKRPPARRHVEREHNLGCYRCHK
jgi:hypothetical protein